MPLLMLITSLPPQRRRCRHFDFLASLRSFFHADDIDDFEL